MINNETYILVIGDIITRVHNNATPVAFKNFAPFIKCITKIDGTTIDDAKDLGLVMLMNIVRIILTRQVIYGFILKIKELI